MAESHFFRDDIGGPKADPPDVIRQAIGVFLNDGNTLGAIGLEDLCRVAGAHVVPLQKEHDIFDLLLLLPALFHLVHTCLSDSGHTKQSVRVALDHLQRILAESLHDPAGKLGTDPPDQSAPQIFFYSVHCRGERLLEALSGKLPAVLCVDLPAAGQLQDTSHMYLGHGSDYRHQFPEALGPAPDHGITVHLIMVGNALDNAAQLFHRCQTSYIRGTISQYGNFQLIRELSANTGIFSQYGNIGPSGFPVFPASYLSLRTRGSRTPPKAFPSEITSRHSSVCGFHIPAIEK